MAMKKLTGTLLFFVFCIFVCVGCSNKTGEIAETVVTEAWSAGFVSRDTATMAPPSEEDSTVPDKSSSSDDRMNDLTERDSDVPFASNDDEHIRSRSEYGVFIGINEKESDRLEQYKLVVIEPSEFSAMYIEKLHAAEKTVYGYLNIGSVEEYRFYYDQFQELFLGVYDDWPDEQWIDVASPKWQNFIIDELGKQYADMGLDGLFLDNADVFYYHPAEDIFLGLCAIMQGLRKYGLKLIVNGGDCFVSKCMEKGIALTLFDGVNQETVFTSIDFENQSYGVHSEEETAYFKKYLAKVKEYGLSVCLLEYGADRSLSGKIDAYCSENNFLWYNANGIELR